MRLERRVSVALRALCVAIAVVLADVAWGALVNGPGAGIGWALSAIGFAYAMSRRSTETIERQAAVAGLGGQIAIAVIRALVVDAPVARIGSPVSVDTILVLVSLAAACLISARFAEEGRPEVRVVLDSAGLAVIGYLSACSLDGVALVVALAAEACVLAAIARARGDEVARVGALAFLGAAGLHTLAIEAPPRAFLYGVPDVLAMAGAVLAVTLATLRVAQSTAADARMLLWMRAGAAATAMFGVSVAIVSAFQPSADSGPMLLDLGVRQEGQMLVSALWSLTGAATLVVGLRRGKRELRLAGLAVLIASVGKVFLFDLATLTSIYRVLSFIALGLILLGGSYAWQRNRPAPLPDLREA